jgi:hypothetical protein
MINVFGIVPLDEDKREFHRKCKVCGVWTMSYAQTNSFDSVELCPDHLNRDSLLKLVEPITYSMIS